MIEINNLTDVEIDENFLKKIAKKLLEKENGKNLELSIALINREEIKKLNKKYRKKNKPTDVLAFSGNGKCETRNFNEIIICPQEVKKNSQKYKSTFKKESAKVLIHGILHLLGETHEKSEKKAEKMRKKEENYLIQFKI